MRMLAATTTLIALSAMPKCDACAPKTLEERTVVLARSPARMSMHMLEDETVVLDANVEAFEVKPDDSLALLGDLASYEVFLPAADDPAAAYRAPIRSLHGSRTRLEARGTSASFAFDGARWEKKPGEKPPPYDYWSTPIYVYSLDLVPHIDEPKDLELPKEIYPSGFVKTRDGTRIVYGSEKDVAITHIPITAIAGPNEKAAKLVRFEADTNARWSCHPVPSADGRTYAACAAPEKIGDPERRLYRLEGREWKRMPLPFRGPPYTAIAIAKDGVPWIAKDDPASVVRVASDRPAEEIALDSIGASLEQAAYMRGVDRRYDDGIRSELHPIEGVETSKRGKLVRVVGLVPRTSGRMLVLVLENGGATTLYRIGEGELPIAKRIGTEPDQLVAIEDAVRETRRWVGHCHQVFVELADAKAAVAAAEAANGDGTVWTAIEGRLKKRRVFGVVALSVAKEADATFERTVTELVDAVTKNPASPPTVTCSLPVLDRVL